MHITIVGAGNVGTQFAAHASEHGHKVTIFTSRARQIRKNIQVVNENGQVICAGAIEKATENAEEAFSMADVIFVTVPPPQMLRVSTEIEPFIKSGVRICLVPGAGGGECAFKNCMKKGAVLFGLQRVPSVARLVEYGHIVRAVGYREKLFIAAFPHSESKVCCQIISQLFDIPCEALPNYLNITLTPSNQILHTVRLRNIYKDWKDGIMYENVPLFYEDWNDEASELLLQCDEELQNICKVLQVRGLNVSGVKPLRAHYESDTAKAMTKKISGIAGFKGLESPAIKIGDKYMPDLQSRYFTSDFPFGLSIVLQIAHLMKVDVPVMQEIWWWFQTIDGTCRMFRYSDYGIITYSDFENFYIRSC